MRNDFQEAMERVDEAYLNEILSNLNENEENSDTEMAAAAAKPKAGDVKVITDAISYEEILELVFVSYYFY